jgi:hypothetical protein
MTTLNSIIEAINADDINAISSVYKLMLSLLLGALVGYERKKRAKVPACAHSRSLPWARHYL